MGVKVCVRLPVIMMQGRLGRPCRMAADLGSFVGLGDGGSTPSAAAAAAAAAAGPLAPSPFRLPGPYEEAKERKVAAVSDLRNAVKAVRCPFLCLFWLLPCQCMSCSPLLRAAAAGMSCTCSHPTVTRL